MAVIENERDKILQAAPVRFIPPPLPPEIQEAVDSAKDAVDSVKGIEILSDGTVFKVTGGVATPSTITFAINFRLISGTVTWSVVQGVATLTGAGNTRFLAAANMSTDRVRIRASITVEGVTYTDEIDITKVYDGADGADGANARVLDLRASSFAFHVNNSGTPNPSSITLTAVPVNMTGTVTWSVVSGTATLTGSGNTRTLTYANMSSGVVTIRASITVDSVLYQREVTIVKLLDGTPGTPGSNGIRGSRTFSVDRSPSATWSDAVANNTITSETGSSERVSGDTITQFNTTAGWAETRYWTGSAWQFQQQVIDGNLIVTGTLSFGKLTGGEANFSNFSGHVSIGQGTRGIGIMRDTPGSYNSTCLFVSDANEGTSQAPTIWALSQNRPRTVWISGTAKAGSNWGYEHPVVLIESPGSQGAIAATMSVISARSATTTIIAQNTGASTQLDLATGAYAAYAASGTYGPFTGSHEAAIDPSDLAGQGDIVVDDELLQSDSLIDTFHRVKMSAAANQAGAVGVVIRRGPFGSHVPAAYQWPNHEHDPAFDDVQAQYELVVLAAVGEGQINVCGQNGNISKGDLIVCSDIPGKGMRQDDNIVRSYTVAKARADVTFDSPTEVKLVPCIYLCG